MKKLLFLLLFLPLSLFGEWVLQNSGVNNTLYDVHFVDSLHGWIPAGSEGGKGLILRTTNGGVNWEKVYTDTNQILYTIGFFDSLEGWAGGVDARAGQINTYYPAIFIHTTDGGMSWNKKKEHYQSPFSSNSISFGEKWYEWVDQIYIVDSTYGFYMIYGHYINAVFGNWIRIVSLDGIHKWREGNEANCAMLWGLDLCFIDSLRGWVLKRGESSYYDGRMRVLYTNMGIESLSVICVIDSSADYGDIDFVDTLRGWIVYGAPLVLHTIDGGTSWVTQSTSVTSGLNALDFLDSLNGWVVGANGIILRTRDGGNSWLVESTPTSATIRSLCFVDTLHGWAVGDSGKILCYRTWGVEEERFFAGAQNDRLEVEPNPFSSVVRIKYLVNRETNVSLKIYNITGRLIEVLVDGKIEPGYYEVEWYANGLPRGIYFANLITPNSKVTKKLILTH